MMHWDDVRPPPPSSATQPQPSMKALFDSPSTDITILADKTYECTSVVTHAHMAPQATTQPLCTEMLHWDEMRRGESVMEKLVPFAMQRIFLNTQSMSLENVILQTLEADPARASPAFCTEMQHWEDYKAAKRM